MATNSSANIVTAAAGKVLQGAGLGVQNAFSTATYPSATVGTGKILYDNGTNFVTSVPTFPASASATSRKIIVSDGTNWTASTETYAVPGTSGNVLTSDGTNWTSAAASGPSGLSFAQVTLTSAQIKALHATPIQIIAAPGAGKMIVVVSASFSHFVYGGSNVFTAAASQTVSLYYGTATAVFFASAIPNAIITGSASTICVQDIVVGNGPSANFRNVAINAYNPVVTEIAGNAANNNTITFAVLYYIVTF
jgi:hypothetical protein